MSKSSKTQTILKDKSTKLQEGAECLPCKAAAEAQVVQQPENTECVPCQAKNNTLWKVYVYHNDFFGNTKNTANSYKLLGDALQQFALFSSAHVQSVFTSMALLPNEWHLIYSGHEQAATQIHNALVTGGVTPRIEASLKTF